MTKVSVALATYNGARYLREQLDSFLLQQRRPDELVVSDDASTDETVAVIEAFAGTAPFPVRIERKTANSGYIRNFQTALAACSGDVIFMSDQDDIWFPEKIAAATTALEQDPGRLLFVNDAELVDEELRPLGLTTFAQVRARGESEKAFTQGACLALRRRLLTWVLPLPDGYPFHDMWISDLANDLGAVLIEERPLQLFRRHSTNASVLTMPDARRETSGPALSTSLAEDIRPGLERRAAMTSLRLERLKAVAGADFGAGGVTGDTGGGLSPADAARTAKAIDSLTHHLRAIEARLATLGRPRPLRPPAVIRMLATGGYAHFSGLKSAAADFVRK